ncbi:MAG TPA: SAM-dependent chlorinase/fluorinase [Polyangiaceae bacterium]|nr:SAM-dependent chlorinase/fluorinase [Polyangiaceae bacterium]
MQASGIITLLTDFGSSEPYAGVMKGVILQRFPEATLVDLTHEIPPQSLLAGAFWLGAAYPWFPAGTVHLAVVDPGVGSSRAPVALAAHGHYFVGPDNGLFEFVRRGAETVAVRRLEPERLKAPALSRTFHGRDLFAPAAALLASGALGFEALGPEHELAASLTLPAVVQRAGAREGEVRLEGAVVAVDRFGNLITNLEPRRAPAEGRVHVAERVAPCSSTYADVAAGELVAYLGSFGQLEVGVRNGSAARELKAGTGTPVYFEGPWSG